MRQTQAPEHIGNTEVLIQKSVLLMVAVAAASPVPTQSHREAKLRVRRVSLKCWLRAVGGGACTCNLSCFRRDDSLHTRDQDQPGIHKKKITLK